MQNKKNRWLDVQIVIASLTLTFSLALWNLFAGNSHPAKSGEMANPTQVISNPKRAAAPTPSSQPATIIYLGGPAPRSISYLPPASQAQSSSAPDSESSPSSAPVSVSSSSSAPESILPPSSAPEPVTSTSSSRP